MATDSPNAQSNMDDSAHIDTVVDGGLQATSTTPKHPVDNPLNTTVALANDVVTLKCTPADLSILTSGGRMAKFTDLSVEVLVLIADLLLDRYLETRPTRTLWQERTSSWRDLYSCSGDNFDKSFFVARKINQAMRYACRRAFLRNDPWLEGQQWATLGTGGLEHRLVLEEKLKHTLEIATMRLRQRIESSAAKVQHGEKWLNRLGYKYHRVMDVLYWRFDIKLRVDKIDLLKHKGSEPLELSTHFPYYLRWDSR